MTHTEIKSAIEKEFAAFAPHPVMEKAVDYIKRIESPAFWTQEAAPYVGNAIGLIMEFAGPNGILLDGSSGDRVARIDQNTGEITETKRTV